MDCIICDRPVQDTGLVCWDDVDQFKGWLNYIADTEHELEPVLARQTHHGDASGRPSAETPLPLNAGAFNTRRHINHVLGSWSLLIMEELAVSLPQPPKTPIGPLCLDDIGCRHGSCNVIRRRPKPDHSIPALARFVSGHVGKWLRHKDFAVDAWAEIRRCKNMLNRAIDAPSNPLPIGPCWSEVDGELCETALHAPREAMWTTCPDCKTKIDVPARRSANVERSRDHLVTRLDVEVILIRWGYPVPLGTIDTWIARGRLPRRGGEAGGRYRLGDALDRAIEWAARQQSKTKREKVSA